MSGVGARSLHIPLLFLVLTALPLIALIWLGWQFLQQDRDLESQRQRDQLQSASELLIRELHSQLQSADPFLRGQADGSAIGQNTFFRMRAGQVLARGGLALPFYPITTGSGDVHSALFAPGERLEFQGHCDLATKSYEQLAAASDRSVRAGAYLRVARCLRKLGRVEEALDVYRRLAALGGTVIAGIPAELLARGERVTLLMKAGKADLARSEEQLLRAMILEGKFVVDRGTFDFFAGRLALAREALEQLPPALAAETWSPRWQGEICGRMAGKFHGTWVVGLWCRDPDQTIHVMLIPAAALFERLRPSAESMRVAVVVDDGDGIGIWGALPPQAINVARHLSDLGLPWQLRVGSANAAETGTILARRRTFAVTGLVLMATIVAAAGFFVFRAVHRELEIARLQADFISTVSHEFRTPLTAMNHLTDMLQENAVATERLPQYYGALQRETSRLQRLVEGLLDFRRFEAGRRAYRMLPMEPQETVRQVLDSYAARDDAHRLRASLNAPGATIRGDREALAIAVSNLVDNALKYSPAPAPISVAVEPGGGMVKISVLDHGPGIKRGERRRVFRNFVRGTAAHDGNIKGTGIGLAIVRAVVKAHGGRVDLQTIPGQGSRFTLLLPRA